MSSAFAEISAFGKGACRDGSQSGVISAIIYSELPLLLFESVKMYRQDLKSAGIYGIICVYTYCAGGAILEKYRRPYRTYHG